MQVNNYNYNYIKMKMTLLIKCSNYITRLKVMATHSDLLVTKYSSTLFISVDVTRKSFSEVFLCTISFMLKHQLQLH